MLLSWYRFQQFLAAFIAGVAVISAPRHLLLEAFVQYGIPFEFRQLTLSLADYLLLALLLITALRLMFETPYRTSLLDTIDTVFAKHHIWVWIALLVWSFLSIFWAQNTLLARFNTLHFLACFLLLITCTNLFQFSFQPVLYGFVIGGAIQTVVAVLQALNGQPLGLFAAGEVPHFDYNPIYRPSGLSSHANYLGGYLILSLFAAYCLLTSWKRLVVLVFLAVGLTATLSRSALISAAIGFAPLAASGVWTSLRTKRRVALLGAGLVGAALVIWTIWLVRGDVITRFLSPREFFFADSWQVIESAPLIGVGIGNLMVAVGANNPTSTIDLLPVHNVYLYQWAELGLPGLLMFCSGCLLAIFNRPRSVWTWCFLALCTVMLFDNYWWAVQPFRVLLFLVLALVISAGTNPSIRTEHSQSIADGARI
jgi:O-antigen ligase